jgi:hypothetical protein
MRLTLQVRGGIAAAMRRTPVSLDTASLEPAHADRVNRLAQAVVASQPAGSPSEPVPDAMSYTLTVEESGKVHVVKQRDGELTPEFGQLLNQLASHATSTES